MSINWSELPYDHSGRWEKKIDSIMNPGSKVTWPQFVMECVIYWRTRFLKNYKDIRKGDLWWQPIARDVRNVTQQAHAICNYFPHPDDERLVINAFTNFIRNNRTCTIGQYRKTRVTKTGKINITQIEKDVVIGIKAELDRLLKQRDSFITTTPKETKAPEAIKYKTTSTAKKSSIASLLELEQQIKNKV